MTKREQQDLVKVEEGNPKRCEALAQVEAEEREEYTVSVSHSKGIDANPDHVLWRMLRSQGAWLHNSWSSSDAK